MKFKKIIVFLLLISISVSLIGCGTIGKMFSKDDDEKDILRTDGDNNQLADDENTRETVLYYKDDNGYIVPVMRNIPWPEDKSIAKAAIKNITDGVANREDIGQIGLLPVIPSGTRILGMSIKPDGLCKVDFSNEMVNYDSKAEETAMVQAIVYTLTEFDTISEVEILIEGKSINNLSYGTDLSMPIARENINFLDIADDYDTKVTLYYKGTTNGINEYYVPVTVPTTAYTTDLHTVLSKLFEGPPQFAELCTDIPYEAELLGVETKDGIAYINLSDSVKGSLDQAAFEDMYKNIALTLDQFDEITDIEILIDGKTLEEAGLEIVNPDVPVFANEH